MSLMFLKKICRFKVLTSYKRTHIYMYVYMQVRMYVCMYTGY